MNTIPPVKYYAMESRPDFDRRTEWFFLHQCFCACENMTDMQHCDVDTIRYVGVFNGKHVWYGRQSP